mgnify:FL=1
MAKQNSKFAVGVEATLEKGSNTVILQNTTSNIKNTFIDCLKVYGYPYEEETNIEAIASSQTSTNTEYNIAGQRVNASYKGIVIKNGKKYVRAHR